MDSAPSGEGSELFQPVDSAKLESRNQVKIIKSTVFCILLGSYVLGCSNFSLYSDKFSPNRTSTGWLQHFIIFVKCVSFFISLFLRKSLQRYPFRSKSNRSVYQNLFCKPNLNERTLWFLSTNLHFICKVNPISWGNQCRC